jgi:MraZ protein
LAAQETAGVYLCPSLAGNTLDGFGQALMDCECKRLDELDPFLSGLHDDLASQFVSGSVQLPIDENGRVRLPDDLIAAAALKDRVLFVGMGRRFEIWNPETYAPVKAARLANARAERAARVAQEIAARNAMQAAAVPATPAAEAGTP